MNLPTDTRSASARSSATLSPREVEVLCLVVQGGTSKEVANALFLSKRTVDFHLTSIYGKLQVSNRLQAFREATRLGLIPFEPSFGHARSEA